MSCCGIFLPTLSSEAWLRWSWAILRNDSHCSKQFWHMEGFLDAECLVSGASSASTANLKVIFTITIFRGLFVMICLGLWIRQIFLLCPPPLLVAWVDCLNGAQIDWYYASWGATLKACDINESSKERLRTESSRLQTILLLGGVLVYDLPICHLWSTNSELWSTQYVSCDLPLINASFCNKKRFCMFLVLGDLLLVIYLFVTYDLPKRSVLQNGVLGQFLWSTDLLSMIYLYFCLFCPSCSGSCFLSFFSFSFASLSCFSPFFLPASFVFLVFWCWCSGLTRLSQSNKRKQGRRTSKRKRKRK